MINSDFLCFSPLIIQCLPSIPVCCVVIKLHEIAIPSLASSLINNLWHTLIMSYISFCTSQPLGYVTSLFISFYELFLCLFSLFFLSTHYFSIIPFSYLLALSTQNTHSDKHYQHQLSHTQISGCLNMFLSGTFSIMHYSILCVTL